MKAQKLRKASAKGPKRHGLNAYNGDDSSLDKTGEEEPSEEESDEDIDMTPFTPAPNPKYGLAFMRNCRQIYHETCDHLYRHGRFGIEVFCHSSCSIQMLNKPVKLADIRVGTQPHFGALQHIKTLDIMITTDWYTR